MTDDEVRRAVYDGVTRTGRVPLVRELGEGAEEALPRLATARIFVLQRDSNEILMAAPFSAVPTPFVVESGGVWYFANCIWDALGIPAMLHRDARIGTSCADCGTAAEVSVVDGKVIGEGLLHFAVPARQWWENIVFT